MDSVEIPYLFANTRIDSALSELRARKRAGLVMRGSASLACSMPGTCYTDEKWRSDTGGY